MSTIRLNPYVNFQGKAREALTFYQKVLGGELHISPEDPSERVTRARLESDGMVIVAVDGHPNYPATVGDNMALALGGTDKERIATIFNGLAEGGKITMPLREQPDGSLAGFLVDPFGIHWTATVDPA